MEIAVINKTVLFVRAKEEEKERDNGEGLPSECNLLTYCSFYPLFVLVIMFIGVKC